MTEIEKVLIRKTIVFLEKTIEDSATATVLEYTATNSLHSEEEVNTTLKIRIRSGCNTPIAGI